jgi:hypothetical protein
MNNAFIVLISLVLACCTSRPVTVSRTESPRSVNHVHLPDIAHVMPEQNQDPKMNADYLAKQAEREFAIEEKGAYQALADTKITDWTEKVGALKITAKRLGRRGGVKLMAKANLMQNQISTARNHLNEMRVTDVNEFSELRKQLELDLRLIQNTSGPIKSAE